MRRLLRERSTSGFILFSRFDFLGEHERIFDNDIYN
jgi:hypothetical protein